MNALPHISLLELVFAFSLIIAAILLSRLQRLDLEKQFLLSTLRMWVQVMLLGYVVKWVLGLEHFWAVLLLVGVMSVAGGAIACERLGDLRVYYWFITGLIILGLTVVMGWMLAIGVLEPKGFIFLPMAGMIVGKTMNTAAICLVRLRGELKLRLEEIETALSLGASPRQAAWPAIHAASREALIPTLNNLAAMGVVLIPGMMAGQILAGADPTLAASYQVAIMFMMASSGTLTAILAAGWGYRLFFTKSEQLRYERLRGMGGKAKSPGKKRMPLPDMS